MSSSLASRNASVDYLRFLGALGIVLFHMGLPGAWVGLAALPMFVTLIVFYGLDRPLAAHARRLLIPWVIWSVVYGCGKLAQMILEGTSFGSEFAPWMIMTGTSLHLWFLPFVFLFLVFAQQLQAAIEPLVFRMTLWPVLVSVAVLWIGGAVVLPIPLPQWCSVIPAALAGAALAQGRNASEVFAVLGGGAALLIFFGVSHGTWQLLLASGAMWLAFMVPLSTTSISTWAADVAFGIYLIHPLIYAVVLQVLPIGPWATFAVVTLGSIAGTMILLRVLPRAV